MTFCVLLGWGNVQVFSQPANDDKADAQVITGASGQVTGSTVGATKEIGEASHGGSSGGASVWFQWRAPDAGEVTFNTSGSSFDTLLAVYEGATLIAENDDDDTVQSAVRFSASQGHAYLVAVDGYDGRTGSYVLNWRLESSAPAPATFTQVSAGYEHTCGIRSAGDVACWGRNDYGQSTPPSGTFTQVDAGAYHTCGIRSAGDVACWGYNDYGQSTPPSGTFTQVGAGGRHICGIRSAGDVACWGSNEDGEATPPSGTFTQVSAGEDYTCGIRSAGDMACWGFNSDGQATPPSGTPTPADPTPPTTLAEASAALADAQAALDTLGGLTHGLVAILEQAMAERDTALAAFAAAEEALAACQAGQM